ILKTHLALSHSGNIATDGQVVVPEYGDPMRCLELLETPSGWNLPMGLYLHGEIGKIINSTHQLSFNPIYNDADAEMLGMIMELYGFRFGLLFSPRKPIADAFYRPGLIEVVKQNRRHNIFISWNDEVRHGGITLRNETEVPTMRPAP
ncbi:hypothetical protein, partial [Elstera sp.]|uniref:hypothetical protein n=1 Tax=Elstera sp. TaxID=1916664 RepID=UPI0037C14BE6